MPKTITQRKLDYFRTSGNMDDPRVVEEYSKFHEKGGFVGEMFLSKWVKKILSLKPDAEIIADIGTGPGSLSVILAKLSGKKVYAVDISPNMLKKAAELATKAGVQISIVEADCQNLPFSDKSLDLVCSTNLIHVLENPVPFFIELKRVVKPGGRAYIQGYRRDTLTVIHKMSRFHTDVILKNSSIDGMAPVLDASFTKTELEDSLRKADLTDFSVDAGILILKAVIRF